MINRDTAQAARGKLARLASLRPGTTLYVHGNRGPRRPGPRPEQPQLGYAVPATIMVTVPAKVTASDTVGSASATSPATQVFALLSLSNPAAAARRGSYPRVEPQVVEAPWREPWGAPAAQP